MADLNYYFGPWQRDAEQGAWIAPTGTVGLLDFGSLNDCAISPSAIDQRGIGLFCTPRGTTLPSEYDLLDSGDCREIQVTTAHIDLVEAVLGVRIDAAGMTLAQACAELFGAGDPTGLERWKPLTPTREGLYEIHLGGHSTIWGSKFDGPSDKTWNKLRDLLRHDLQRHDAECKAEAKTLKDLAKELRKQKKDKEVDACDARAAKVENHAEKVLDGICLKYGCDPLKISTTIKRGKAQTTINDTFDATWAGYTVYNEGGGSSTWTSSGGYGYASSNNSTGYAFNDTNLSSADHYAQASHYWGLINREAGACARCSSSALTCYTAYDDVSGHVAIYKIVAGTRTFLARSSAYDAYSHSSGEVWKQEASGSTQTGTHVDSGISKSTTDTAISTGVRIGMWDRRDNGGSGYGSKFGSLYGTDGIAEGPVIPVLMNQYRQRRR